MAVNAEKTEMITEQQIGGTTYIIRTNFNDNAKEAILLSIRRLIQREAEKII